MSYQDSGDHRYNDLTYSESEQNLLTFDTNSNLSEYIDHYSQQATLDKIEPTLRNFNIGSNESTRYDVSIHNI